MVLSGIIGSINNSMGIKIRVLYRKREQQMAAERIIRGDDKILIIAKPEETNQVSAIPIMATRQSPVVIKAGSKAGREFWASFAEKDARSVSHATSAAVLTEDRIPSTSANEMPD